MRLIYSWELSHDKPGYNIISKDEYLTLKAKHVTSYENWKREMAPVIIKKTRGARLQMMKLGFGESTSKVSTISYNTDDMSDSPAGSTRFLRINTLNKDLQQGIPLTL